MIKSLRYLYLLTFLCSTQTYSQSGAPSCSELQNNFNNYQACATSITFDNSTNNNNGEDFETTCIGGDLKGPTWFFIRIKNPGDMNLKISQVTNSGNPSDVDFVLWGPFHDMNDICSKLNISNEKDCSYLPDPEENVYIPNSQSGDIYILLVDNYENVPGQITIAQTGGSGTTDCSFLSSVKIKDSNNEDITELNYCKPETKDLVASVNISDFPGNPVDLRFNYKWYRNDVLVSAINDSFSNTNTFNASETGLYKVTLTAYDSSDTTVDLNNLILSEAEINLTFTERITLNTGPHNISICDYTKPYNDGIVMYNLMDFSHLLYNSAHSIQLEFSLNNTFDELITNPENFINDSEFQFTIYARAFHPNQNLVCYSDIAVININVNVIPGTEVLLEKIIACSDSGFANFDLTIRESIIETENPSNPTSIRYYENLNDAISNNSNFIQNPKFYTNSIKDGQTIYLQIPSTDHNNTLLNIPCNRIIELELLVNPYPENLLSKNPYKICVDQFNNIINKAVIDAKLPHTEYDFIWYKEFDAINGNQLSFGNSNIFETDIPGNYSVKIVDITNNALCSTVANFTVRNSYIPENITVIPEQLIGFETENTIVINAFPVSQDYEYMINNIGWQSNNTFYNVKEGIYLVTVRNKFGCGETTSSFIIADYPKFFTPNQDGYNDYWNIGGQQIFDNATIYIFDKQGKLLKDISNSQTGWDGTFDGQPLPSDDYWFTINYEINGIKNEFKSHFTLKR